MEQSEEFSNPGDQHHPGEREVVFVLRVRAGNSGWWGQVHRLDVGSLLYVANHSELFAMLAHEWDLNINSPPDTRLTTQD